MFRVGQKVVCVDATWGANWLGRVICLAVRYQWPLKRDAVYTVQRCYIHEHLHELCVVLVEAKNLRLLSYAFRATRFRPLVERKTDISAFTEMLNPTPEKVLEYQHGSRLENPTREQV